jgi:hypothetical protein
MEIGGNSVLVSIMLAPPLLEPHAEAAVTVAFRAGISPSMEATRLEHNACKFDDWTDWVSECLLLTQSGHGLHLVFGARPRLDGRNELDA